MSDKIEKDVNWLQTKLKAKSERIQELMAENAKLNIILYHRENGLSHPDFNAEISISKQAERIKELEEIYLGQIRVIARSRITYKERVERMVALAEQALMKGK